ncbi:MAG: 4'-phosphopantetheinyl transferase superfamily protein [Tannerellaceae bacterium]|jgi:phosphopantetheinyl transferase|nr:4'-phosphopantetheinyl transferase superfamily protein [Tannerellaceae bacterium]
MPLFIKHAQPLWGVWKIDESANELLTMLTRNDVRLLPDKIRAERRRQEWLAVRVLLKELIGEETLIAYHTDGAPYLPEKNLHISISHTNGYAAVIVSEQFAAGIDIEHLNDRIHRVRKRFMHPKEDSMIDTEHETEHLLVCWCAKETLIKLIRHDGTDLREHLRLSPFKYEGSGYFTAFETRTPRRASYSLYYIVNKYFAMTCCLDMMVVIRPSLLNSMIMVLLFLMT